MPTRTGYGAPQLPHRPQHKPRPEQNQSLTPNRPHAAEPTRKALVTRESLLCLRDWPISGTKATYGSHFKEGSTSWACSLGKWVVAIGIVSILVLVATACGGDDDGTFRIGVMESLTGPGETYGTVANQAKQMAVDEINEAGGINGRMIELVVEDSKCNAQDSITAYNKLTDVEGIKIILGTSCSGAMLGAAPLAEEDGVVMFSGLATNPDIAEAGDYIFRTSMSDAQLGIDTGNLLWADGIRTLATINEATDYAEGVRRESVAQFEKRGGPDGRRGAVSLRHDRLQGASLPS